MAEAVLLSIKPKWADLILQGKKYVEVRKSRPQRLEEKPFKVYLYQSQKQHKVIGECVCELVMTVMTDAETGGWMTDGTCLSQEEMYRYSNGRELYGWVLHDAKIYEEPKTLTDFGLKRPPQSWCYVQESR